MKVTVAGAGIAGLAAAALLARDGHDVTVYDQFPEPQPVGSGLMVQPVGLEVLRRLGRDGAVRDRAAPIIRILGRTGRGRDVLDLDYRALGPDAVGLGVQRAMLFEQLLDAALAAGVRLRPDTQILGLAGAPEAPRLVTDSGETEAADLVLDCLGASSPLCPEPSAPLAYGALWALLDWPRDCPFAPDRLEQRYRHAARMVGVLPVGTRSPGGSRKLTFFWSLKGTAHADWRARPLALWKDEVRALWPETDILLGQIASHDDLIFAQYTHHTLGRPGRGYVAHLGDSFHATSPQLGQGANMALLDALALAEAVRQTPDLPGATALYGRLRRWHVRLYQTASWVFTPVYQSDSRVLPWLRDRLAAPVSRVWPMPGVLARLVAGEVGRPLARLGGGVSARR